MTYLRDLRGSLYISRLISSEFITWFLRLIYYFFPPTVERLFCLFYRCNELCLLIGGFVISLLRAEGVNAIEWQVIS